MSFLWHTALSVIDLSSSLLYNLLGRDLTDNDIQLIELLFAYVSKTELNKLFANKSQLNLSLSSNNSSRSNQLTVNDLEKCLEYDSKQISNLINLLLTSIDSFKSKDLLLITNKQNGYNIIQTLTECILKFSHNILTQNYKLFSEKNSNNMENDFDHIIQQRINLLKILLHNYSCDPNRGLLLSNKTRYCVNITNEQVNFFLTPKSTSKTRHKYKDFSENKSFHSNNVLINFEIDTSEEDTQNNTHIDKTKIESETLSEITVETIIKNKNSPINCQKNTTNLRPASPCSYITNIDLSLITNYSDEKTISQLTSLPIDTPLLLICCVYNSNNLLSLSNLNRSTKSNKTRQAITPQIPLIDFPQRRRNTIQVDSLPDKPFRLSRSNSVKSVNNNENSELYSLWSSSSSSGTKTRSSSGSFSTESSLSFDSLDSSELSPYTKSVDSISKLFKSSSKFNKNQNFDECPKSESESSDNYNQISYSNTESQHSDENQSDSDSDDDSSLNSSNIYDYEEKDEENYYDKYDYDFNSACYKIDSSSSYFDSYRQPRNSLSTSIHSLMSSSNENSKNLNSKSATCSIRSNLSNKNNFIYEKLNELRLKLVDLLLNSGADKYLISKLTLSNMKQMNRKSKMMLKKWYGISRFESNASEAYTDADVESDPDSDSCELRPLSPIMASLCLDDVDIFSRLYKHQQNLFNYFKPDEDYELIYYAIKFQSKNCLVYLLSNLDSENLPTLFETNSEKRILNKNVNTMFYILENTRSSKIIKVLLNCGFDLTKREPLTGNTALHCLFNANTTTTTNKYCRSKKVLSEYNDPKSLSRILFLLLKKGGLKTHVNTLNNERKLCIQSLFEWDELIENVFFKDSKISNRNEWKNEFKECVRLLIKSGSDLLLNINNNELEIEGYNNCIETLLNSLLKHSIVFNKNSRCSRSPSISNILKTQQTIDPRLSPRAKKFTQQKTLDIEYLDYILNEIVDLNSISVGLSKTNLYTNSTNSTNPETVHRLPPRDCSIEKFLELLLNTHIDDFGSAYTTFKSLLNFQKCLNNKLRLKFQSFNLFKQQSKFISPHVIKRLLTNWILFPNFLNSSNQFEKNNFIKMILIDLIRNNLYDPNDSTTQVHQSTDLIIQSNNLLNHCVQLIFLSKTCYQMELIYDLMRSLIQYGADPNIEPFNLNTSNNFRYKVSNSILAQLCDPFLAERPSPILTGVNLSRPRRNSYKNEGLEFSNYHNPNHHHHHSHHNYFDDYFRDKKFAPINDFHHHHNHHAQINDKDNERRSPDDLKTSNNGRRILSSNPICLLTPSISYSSLINLNPGIISNSVKSNNIVIDSSVLFLNYYKRYVKLLFDSMENGRILEVLRSKNIGVDLSNGGFCTHHNSYHHHSYHRSGYHLKSGQKVYAIESLDMYLERLVSSPRSLKSLCRRSILNRLSETQKLQNDLNNENGLVQVTSQIEDFNIPKRVKNYLLFIE